MHGVNWLFSGSPTKTNIDQYKKIKREQLQQKQIY